MLHRARLFFAFAALLASVLASEVARAQISSSSSGGTIGNGGTETISSSLPNPNRALFQNGQYVDVTNNPRPQNLNPTGVNFSDCEQDLKLTFPIVVSGFNGGSGIEVWAGTTDCTQATARAVGGIPTCWLLSSKAQQLLDPTTTSMSIDVFARDVMRFMSTTPPQVPSYDPTFHSSAAGEAACHQQASDAAVTVNIFFIPVQVSANVGQATGTAYQYPLITDTVAPPPPPEVSLGLGDTLLEVMWTSPGNDPDIAGFAVWSDPPSGGTAGSGSCSCGGTPGSGGASSFVGDGSLDGTTITPLDASQLVCEDAASDASSVSDAADAGDGAVTDAAPDALADAALPDAGALDAGATDAGTSADAGDGGLPPGCHLVNVGGGGACNSFALTGSTFIAGQSSTTGDGATTVTPTPVTTFDDSGNALEGGVTLSGGGISEIAPQFKAGEVDDRTATQLTLTGLSNGTNYVVVVTSIDGSGNVGPPSTPQCAQPAPVEDFWGTYKKSGGGASGCALEGAGLPAQMPVLGVAVAALATLLRRRKRRP